MTRQPHVAESPSSEFGVRSGLRLRPYRPMRAVVGGIIVLGSVVAAWALLAEVAERDDVLMLTREIEAGEQIEAADLRVVSIGSDDHLATLAASERDVVVGRYARYRLPADRLLVAEDLQLRPLVSPGHVLMSVAVSAGEIPVGTQEMSRVALVVTLPPGCRERKPVLVEATVVALPRGLELVRSAGERPVAGQRAAALRRNLPERARRR
jgi:hypothetical protein